MISCNFEVITNGCSNEKTVSPIQTRLNTAIITLMKKIARELIVSSSSQFEVFESNLTKFTLTSKKQKENYWRERFVRFKLENSLEMVAY